MIVCDIVRQPKVSLQSVCGLWWILWVFLGVIICVIVGVIMWLCEATNKYHFQVCVIVCVISVFFYVIECDCGCDNVFASVIFL